MAGRPQLNDEDNTWSAAPGVGSFFIRPAFVECSYNEIHLLTKENLMGHIIECRKKYARKCEEKGEIPLTLKCKYNTKHVVYAPEIQFHEERCKDAYFVPTYLLNTELFKDCPGYDPSFPTLEVKPTLAEVVELREECYNDTFIGAEGFGMAVTQSELEKFNTTYQIFEERCDFTSEESEKDEDEWVTSAEEEGAVYSTGTPTPDTEDEEETTIPKDMELSLATEQKEVDMCEQDVDYKAETEEEELELHLAEENDDDEALVNEKEGQDDLLKEQDASFFKFKYELEKHKYDFVEWKNLNLFWNMIIEEPHPYTFTFY